jgi:hypothetical protein
MDELYVKTPKGIAPISREIARKYHLKPGAVSPFSGSLVVDARGRASAPEPPRETLSPDEKPRGDRLDGIAQMDMGLEMKTSEMIDFAQGVDSTLYPERFPE